MIEWRSTGILLSTRKHGETSAIVEVFTPDQGRAAGVVRGASSRKMAPVLQPGAQLDVTWKARLEDHLGSYTVELIRSRAGQVMADRLALAGLSSTLALLSYALAERDPHPALYQETETLLDLICVTEAWPLAYARWEVTLLNDLGFGLDLTTCAATGTKDDLIYVSPKSGRAVSRGGAGAWANRLLPLPAALTDGEEAEGDITTALDLTGHFLAAWLAPAIGKPLPEARHRFVQLARKFAI